MLLALQVDIANGNQKLAASALSAVLITVVTDFVGMTKAAAAAAADETPLQPAPSPQSTLGVTAMSSECAVGAKAGGGAELLPGRKRLRKKPQSSAAPTAEKIQQQLNSGTQLVRVNISGACSGACSLHSHMAGCLDETVLV